MSEPNRRSSYVYASTYRGVVAADMRCRRAFSVAQAFTPVESEPGLCPFSVQPP